MDSSDDKEALAKRNVDRDQAIAELTKNLAWKLCTDLLSPPLGSITVAASSKYDSGTYFNDGKEFANVRRRDKAQ
jgi:hypothetical protein